MGGICTYSIGKFVTVKSNMIRSGKTRTQVVPANGSLSSQPTSLQSENFSSHGTSSDVKVVLNRIEKTAAKIHKIIKVAVLEATTF